MVGSVKYLMIIVSHTEFHRLHIFYALFIHNNPKPNPYKLQEMYVGNAT